MRVLLLSPYPERIIDTICDEGDEVLLRKSPVTDADADFIVSYGYRHLLKKPLLGKMPAINLHVSYLPWNKGADPNIWSWIEKTPKGVTIHEIDEGLDTGKIIAQRLVGMTSGETVASSYEKLRNSIESLFREIWPEIRAGRSVSYPQMPGGTFHRAKEAARIKASLPDGYDTPCEYLVKLGPQRRAA